jgi:hypothetical protein
MSAPKMPETKQVPRERLHTYFEEFTKRFLRDESPEVVDVEVIEPEFGDQVLTAGARLLGITFEPRKNSLEIMLETGDHRDLNPQEVWVVEEPDGFVSAVEVVRDDGSREVLSVKRVGARRID